MNRSMPGLPVYYQLPESTQTCPLSQWCHPTISSSIVPFSSCPQFFLASGSLQMNQLFTSGGQSIGVSASVSVLPVNTQDWSPLRWTGWISLQSKGLSKSLLKHHQNHQFFDSAFFAVQLSHLYMTTGKTIALTRWTFVDKIVSLLFNMLSSLVITLLPRSKRLTVILHITTLCHSLLICNNNYLTRLQWRLKLILVRALGAWCIIRTQELLVFF